MRIDYHLKDALTWRFLAVALLPLLILSIVFFGYFSQSIEDRFVSENRAVANAIASRISLELREPAAAVSELSRILELTSPHPDQIPLALDELVKNTQGLSALFLSDPEGKIVAAGLPGEFSAQRARWIGQQVPGTPVRGSASANREISWSREFTSPLSGRDCLAMSCRMPSGSLVAHVNISHLYQRYQQQLSSEGVHLALLDEQGQLLFQFPQGRISALQSIIDSVDRANPATFNSLSLQYQFDDTTYLGTSALIPENGWKVLYGQRQTGLLNRIWQLRFAFIAGVFAAILLASIWARSLARNIIRPIFELTVSAKSFRAGDYQHPLPYGTHAEIDELSDSFRDMREAIDHREQQLVNHREYFFRLFNGVADAIFVSERRQDGCPGRFIEVNDQACQMLGYQREQLLRMSPYDLNRIAIEDPDAFNEVIEAITNQRKALFKTEFKHLDGSWIPVEISTQLFHLDGREVYFSVARDITLREKYESSIQALVRSTVGLTGQECLNEITMNLCHWLNADGACIALLREGQFDVQSFWLDGRPLEDASLALENTPYQEIIGGQFCFYPSDISARFPEFTITGQTRVQGFVGIPMIGQEGQTLGLVCAFSRSAMSAMPHVEELLSVIASRAVAECERLRYEQELSHGEEMLRTLFNSTAEAIVGIDRKGICIFCNPAAVQMLGYQQEADLEGKAFYQMVGYQSGQVDSGCPFIAEIICDERILQADGALRCRDGSSLPVEYWGHPLLRGGQMVGGVITFIDISRRRTLEKQLQHSQRMEAIGTLTGGIAHDFNNILTVISGYVGLLQAQCQEDSGLLAKIGKIGEAAERGSKLTHGLLAYSRKKSGPSTPLDINQVVLKVQDLFGKMIGERIEQRLTLTEKQLVVLGDVSQLEQVLVNLATNARDAMSDGGILTLSTSTASIDHEFCRMHGYGNPGDYAMICVEDNGQGMSREVQQKIFDPFYTTKDTGKGTGLGLAIAWGIVKQHKGYILVESEPGQGSRFNIYLPLTDQKPLPQGIVKTGILPGGEETILLVEDDPLVRESTRSILTTVGYQVLTSDCAESALEVLQRRQEDISLILSDVVMPGMKGTEFYQAIRSKTEMPVIFFSGYTFDSLREQGLVGEGFILLNKPIQPIDLLTRIREILGRTNSPQEG